MRTTVDIQDALAQDIKQLAAKKRTTMRALIEEGLRLVLEAEAEAELDRSYVLPDTSVGGEGFAEGIESLDWETMSRAIYGDR